MDSSIIYIANLDPSKVMELNDAINQEKALKSYWERRIKTIGGPKYAQKIAESEKDDLDLMSGDVTSYKYFFCFP